MDGAGVGGVVLISFGSTIELEKIPSVYIDMFFKLIRKHQNVRFILKWKGPFPKEFEAGLDNLLSASWLPQRELLSMDHGHILICLIILQKTTYIHYFNYQTGFCRTYKNERIYYPWWIKQHSRSNILWHTYDCASIVCW